MAFEVVESGASRIAIIRIVNPPINAVSAPVRRMIVETLDDIAGRNDIAAVVLCGSGRLFASGIPLREIGEGIASPGLSDLCERIEMFERPVVALMEGHVAAAGFEIALAAHARIAAPGAKLGLPDFRLGLSPGGGATQRLPRLIGAEGALTMLFDAKPHLASSQLCQPIVDRIATGAGLVDEAVLLAGELAESGDWVRTRDRVDGLLDPIAFQKQIHARRDKLDPASSAMASRIIEAVEAAQLLPFEAGLALERTCFDDLCAMPRSQGLRRARQSEQRADRLSALTGPPVTEFAVMGPRRKMIRFGGAALLNGGNVILFDPDAKQAEEMREELWTRSRPGLAAKGAAVLSTAEAGLRATSDASELGRVQVVLMAASGTREAIADLLGQIAEHVSSEAVVLCETEQPDIATLAPAALQGRVFGLVMADRDFPARAAEVSIPDGAPRNAIATAQSGLWKLNRLVVRSRTGKPFMMTTLFDAMMAAADGLVRCGVLPSRIDAAMAAHGFARSPYALLMQGDVSGYLSRTMNLRPRLGLSHRVLTESIVPVVDGRISAVIDYAAADMLEVGPLDLKDDDIVASITAALANAGCRLIAEGAAFRPMQIDAIMLHGFGYPRSWGGPMAEADLKGLHQVLDTCRAYESVDPLVWTPHPMLQDFFVNGLNFLDLDHREQDVRAA